MFLLANKMNLFFEYRNFDHFPLGFNFDVLTIKINFALLLIYMFSPYEKIVKTMQLLIKL